MLSHFSQGVANIVGLCLWLVFMCFPNFSAQVCADSLVSGCSFDVTCSTIQFWGPWRQAWNFMIFDGSPGRSKTEEIRPGGGKSFVRGSRSESNNLQELIQDTWYNIKHTGIKWYEKAGMQNNKIEEPRYMIEEMLRSLLAPLPRCRPISLSKPSMWCRSCLSRFDFARAFL